MSANSKFESLPYEMHRTILDFTDSGFEPLKLVNKMFYEFEKMPHRMEAVTDEVKKRRKEFAYNKYKRNMYKMIPYVTSVSLLQWALSEFEMPKNRVVCSAIAYSGHLDVLQWARAQDPPCAWDEDVCRYAAGNGHLDVLQWARAQDPPCDWNADVCSEAADYGYMDIIEWLRIQNLPASWLRHLPDH